MSMGWGSCADFQFEYQPITSELLSQTSCYKRAERNFLADEKGPQHWNQVVVCVIDRYSIGNIKEFEQVIQLLIKI